MQEVIEPMRLAVFLPSIDSLLYRLNRRSEQWAGTPCPNCGTTIERWRADIEVDVPDPASLRTEDPVENFIFLGGIPVMLCSLEKCGPVHLFESVDKNDNDADIVLETISRDFLLHFRPHQLILTSERPEKTTAQTS